MTDASGVTRYLTEVRHGLRGLAQTDVDDTIAEIRTHLLEEIGERGDSGAVLADFGDPAEVASQIVERRLRPEGERAVAQASLGRRYSAWATDMVIGIGPFVIVPTVIGFIGATGSFAGAAVSEGFQPIWLLLALRIGSAWIGDPATRAAAGLDSVPAIPLWQWVVLSVMLAWALYYWLLLRRQRSSSVGMWMTGLRAVRLADDRVVVRERDIAQNPPPLGFGRNRWWICLVLVPIGCWCCLLAVFYLSAGVSTFLASLESPTAYTSMEEGARQDALIAELEGALLVGADARVQDLCAPAARADAALLTSLLSGMPATSVVTVGEEGVYFLTASADSADRLTAVIGVGTRVERSGHTYAETYLVESVDVQEAVDE